MKKLSFVISFLLLTAVFTAPLSVSAAESAGIKPGSFFYGFVTTFEKVNLFFTFNPEKKAEKALKYAEKRLAEAEAVAGDKNSDAVKTAISGYEANVAIAAASSKKVKDQTKAENLLNLIAENTLKHQEVLSDVLAKVPDEAKEAITKALETSRRGYEEATQKIAELKNEVEHLKQEVVELKTKNNANPKAVEQTNKQKSEIAPTPTRAPTPQVSEAIPTLATPTIPTTPPSGGGGGAGAPSGPRLGVPLKCSDYTSYFASISSCEYIKQSSSANKDGVEIEHPLYTLCKQCLSVGSISLPLISNIKAVNITENSATITWSTNELADSEIIYATSSQPIVTLSPPAMKVIDSANTINHSLNLSNLTKNTIYYYKVISVRVSGYPAESIKQSFTTFP
ncbi:MAG: DUF5667 domain-containing protein [Candidatus Giovannonibacteria bacterium]|nr:DUF5667 domain-containing protein [Candidatus Giovannonibacteria bacterium]